MASAPQRIVVIGNTEVGKTTLLLSAYHKFQAVPHGLTLRVTEDDKHEALSRFGRLVAAGQFPTGTSRYSSYPFLLRYQDNKICTFSWNDYSGRMIYEFTQDAQAQALHADLDTANGALVFFDSEVLAQGRLGHRELARLFTLLSVAAQNPSRKFTLALVFTKADLISHYTVPMLRQFEEPLDTIAGSSNIRCALIPVACGQSMRNVMLPLLFVVNGFLDQHIATYKSIAINENNNAVRWEQKGSGLMGAIDVVLSRLSKAETYREMAAKARERALQAQTVQRNTQLALVEIQRLTAQLPLVVDGGTLHEYVNVLNQLAAPRVNRFQKFFRFIQKR